MKIVRLALFLLRRLEYGMCYGGGFFVLFGLYGVWEWYGDGVSFAFAFGAGGILYDLMTLCLP